MSLRGDSTEARRLAFACWRDADNSAVSRAAIQAAVGDLIEYMARAIERTNDEEVKRLAQKDD